MAKKNVAKKNAPVKKNVTKSASKKKQQAGSVERELKAEIKKLRSQLAAAERSAEKWKARAKDQKSSAAGAKAELGTLRKSLEKAQASVVKWKDRARAALPASEPKPTPTMAPAEPVEPAATMAPAVSSIPDGTWTLTALRAEARARGLPGYSRKPKAQLVAELQG